MYIYIYICTYIYIYICIYIYTYKHTHTLFLVGLFSEVLRFYICISTRCLVWTTEILFTAPHWGPWEMEPLATARAHAESCECRSWWDFLGLSETHSGAMPLLTTWNLGLGIDVPMKHHPTRKGISSPTDMAVLVMSKIPNYRDINPKPCWKKWSPFFFILVMGQHSMVEDVWYDINM